MSEFRTVNLVYIVFTSFLQWSHLLGDHPVVFFPRAFPYHVPLSVASFFALTPGGVTLSIPQIQESEPRLVKSEREGCYNSPGSSPPSP